MLVKWRKKCFAMGRLSEKHIWLKNSPKPNKLERLGWNLSVGCYMDLCNAYIKIEDSIFYFERIDEYANINVRLLLDNGYKGAVIATCHVKNHNYFELQFKYNGISCSQRIRYNEIRRNLHEVYK